jgi:hypothetical protein
MQQSYLHQEMRLEVSGLNFACPVSPGPPRVTNQECQILELILNASSKHMDKHERPYRCTIDGCDHAQGFTSKGDLSRHERIVHKLRSAQGSLLFCDEPDCARGPGGGTNAGFSRKDNLADHMLRKHGRTSTASSCVLGRVGNANDTILPDVSLESLRRVDEEAVTSLQRKRRRISEIDLSSQNADRGDGEEIYLRSELKRMGQVERDMKNELTKMTQRVEELTKELKEAQKRHEEKTETLVGIIERLARQSKETTGLGVTSGKA